MTEQTLQARIRELTETPIPFLQFCKDAEHHLSPPLQNDPCECAIACWLWAERHQPVDVHDQLEIGVYMVHIGRYGEVSVKLPDWGQRFIDWFDGPGQSKDWADCARYVETHLLDPHGSDNR